MPDLTYLNWPFFDDEHRALARDLDDWALEHLRDVPEAHEETVDDLCRGLVRSLAEAGWLDYVVPGAQGGRYHALDVRSLCLLRETLGRHHALADFAFVMQGLGSGAISLFGSDELREHYLPAVREGDKMAAFALSEPEAGSDVAAISATAVEDGDHYVIDGTKTWISNGGLADFYTVFARTGEAPGARGLSAFVVDAETPGLEVAERIPVIAPHPLARLVFDGCRVPKSRLLGAPGGGFEWVVFDGCRVPKPRLLGAPGGGFKVAMATLDVFRPTVGAAALGFARRALDEALDRAGERRLFGAPMGELQMVQAKIADMALGVDASALLVYRAAWTKDRVAERVSREAAMAKLYATETAQRVIDDAVQIFGGMGVVSGSPVERLYREIRALRIYEGASEVQKVIIARQALAAHAAENAGAAEAMQGARAE